MLYSSNFFYTFSLSNLFCWMTLRSSSTVCICGWDDTEVIEDINQGDIFIICETTTVDIAMWSWYCIGKEEKNLHVNMGVTFPSLPIAAVIWPQNECRLLPFLLKTKATVSGCQCFFVQQKAVSAKYRLNNNNKHDQKQTLYITCHNECKVFLTEELLQEEAITTVPINHNNRELVIRKQGIIMLSWERRGWAWKRVRREEKCPSVFTTEEHMKMTDGLRSEISRISS